MEEDVEYINRMIEDCPDEKTDKKFQAKIIDLLEKIENIVKADKSYNEHDKETGLLSTLAHYNMVDVINYIVKRKDVTSKYIDHGFYWACRRGHYKGTILAILKSGKVSDSGLAKGLEELKIEGPDILKQVEFEIIIKNLAGKSLLKKLTKNLSNKILKELTKKMKKKIGGYKKYKSRRNRWKLKK